MILKTKTQKGFSLLELLLVVAVGAILILAGLAIYRNITQNTDVNEASRLINVLKQESQRIFQGEPTYAGLTNTVLTNANVVPAKYTTGAGVITTPFNTTIDVTINSANADEFDIDVVDVPQEACLKLGLEYTGNDADFVSVSIGATTIATPTVATVNTACGATGGDMTWVFN
jgi:prepilin-type N-terminal cleavage/methylation domain-containing protein